MFSFLPLIPWLMLLPLCCDCFPAVSMQRRAKKSFSCPPAPSCPAFLQLQSYMPVIPATLRASSSLASFPTSSRSIAEFTPLLVYFSACSFLVPLIFCLILSCCCSTFTRRTPSSSQLLNLLSFREFSPRASRPRKQTTLDISGTFVSALPRHDSASSHFLA